jgi:RNA polymerase sigma factor (sigma-70 family)
MQSKSDAQLLREYTVDGAEAAFTEIVHRYTNLIYSCVARQVGSPDVAAEITQNVFVGLVRAARALAPKLKENASLAGWLCRTARNLSLNFRRDEFRRRSRERQSMETNPASEMALNWELVCPVLDEAMSELSETDYDAVVMRFFQNQDLNSVGLALGVTADTAQKRVSRALDRLRKFLSHRGITTSTGALSVALAGNAVQAAPAGLAASISTAAQLAGTIVSSSAAVSLSKIIAMTTLQKTIIVFTAVGVATTLVIQHRSQVRLREENRSLRQRFTQLKADSETYSNEIVQLKATPAFSSSTSVVTAGASNLTMSSFQQVSDFIDSHREVPREQIEAYLKQNHRTVESLLAAFQVSRDPSYLREAATNSPNDPAVQFAVIANKIFPDAQRKWIDAFKASSPDNALPRYFSALDYFNSKQTDEAIQELAQGSRQQLYSDYAAQTGQAVEEMYDSAGWPALAAKAAAPGIASSSGSYLNALKELANKTVQLQQQYRSQDDGGSAISMAAIGIVLGDQLRRASGPIDQLVGIGIEKKILAQLDPTGTYDFLGRPVSETLAELDRQKDSIREVLQLRDQVRPTLSELELNNYWEREKIYGEAYALQWLQSQHCQP